MRYCIILFLLLAFSTDAFCESMPQDDLSNDIINTYAEVCWQPDIWSNTPSSYDIITESNLTLITSHCDDEVFYELYSIPNSNNYIAIVRKGNSIYNAQYINSTSSQSYFYDGILNNEVMTYFYCPDPASCWQWNGTFVSYFSDGSCVMFIYATPQSEKPRTKIYNPENIYTILSFIPEYSSQEPQIIERIK